MHSLLHMNITKTERFYRPQWLVFSTLSYPLTSKAPILSWYTWSPTKVPLFGWSLPPGPPEGIRWSGVITPRKGVDTLGWYFFFPIERSEILFFLINNWFQCYLSPALRRFFSKKGIPSSPSTYRLSQGWLSHLFRVLTARRLSSTSFNPLRNIFCMILYYLKWKS